MTEGMKFIATEELGRLAKWLRILGFDTEYYRQDNKSSLIISALREDRVVLTRLVKFPETHGLEVVHIASDFLKDQIAQIIKKLNLTIDQNRIFSRCTICNKQIEPIEKEKIKGKVPEYVYNAQEDFFVCPQCLRLYWQGSHWGNIAEILKKIRVFS